jgi:hypothetical protein
MGAPVPALLQDDDGSAEVVDRVGMVELIAA